MCREERGGVFVSYIALTLILVDYGKGLKIRDGTIDFFFRSSSLYPPIITFIFHPLEKWRC